MTTLNFEVAHLYPDGWVVLSPWLETPEGAAFRLHIVSGGPTGHGDDARRFCEHIAAQLNDRPERGQ